MKSKKIYSRRKEKKSPFYYFKVGSNLVSAALSVIIIISVIIAYYDIPQETCSLFFKPNNIDVTDFYTSFIALCTTFVVGFQIYNSIIVGNKIEQLDKEFKTQKEITKQMTYENLVCKYFNAYTIGMTRYNEIGFDSKQQKLRYCWNSIRAYMNALNISAQGGHDFHESISSFGQKKIVKCIDELIEYHKLFKDKGYMNKDIDNNFLPSLDDRRKYISDINNYIDEATEYLEECRKCYFKIHRAIVQYDTVCNYQYISKEDLDKFNGIAKMWSDFVKEYYADI